MSHPHRGSGVKLGRETTRSDDGMELGAFSVSIPVRDLGASRAFYQKMSFEQVGGDLEHYLMMAIGAMEVER